MRPDVAASRSPLYLTYALMLFGFTSIGSARVALSLYALELGASASVVGLLVGSLYIFPLLISWPVGRYADRTGSRWPLLFGAVCGVCALAIPYFARDLAALFVASILLGVTHTVYNVLLPNVVGLVSRPEEHARNFSNASLVGSITMFVGPLMAGIAIDLWSHAAAFLFLALLPLSAGVTLLAWGALLPGGSRAAGPADGMRDTLSDRTMLRLLVASSLVQVGQDLYAFYIPLHGHRIGISASAIGGLLATFSVASIVVRALLPRLIARFGDERVLTVSFYVAALGFGLAPFFESVTVLAVVSFVFGLGMGCGQPITTLLLFNRAAPGRSGEVLGLRQSMNHVLRVSAPMAFGLVATAFGLSPVFWLSALMMGAGGLVSRPRAGKTTGA
jgi:MFS family permease